MSGTTVKIAVTPEGRPHIWLPEAASLKAFIVAKGLESIHNLNPGGMFMIGADHDVKSVLEDIDNSEALAVFTDKTNMGHSLVVIRNNKLECFDIGALTVEDLDIK